MRRRLCIWLWPALLLTALTAARAEPPVICHGADAGGYAAFPDVCRLKNGDLLCVFYSGASHVTLPSEKWPKCGRIMAIRSKDEAKTWGKPTVVMDTPDDDRDPSLACLKDGTLLLSWFALIPAKPPSPKPWSGIRLLLSRSTDSGRTWSDAERIEVDPKYQLACSSPIRQLTDGSLLWPLYHEDETTFGAIIKSYDGGKTWKDMTRIGFGSGIYLDAETDVVTLKDGRLLAALRSSDAKGKGMYTAESSDAGKTWRAPKPIGFSAHCPYFLRHSSGVILLGCRLVGPTSKTGAQTALYWSADEAKTWNGPVTIDNTPGAYPSMVELSDGQVYCVYYEEGEGSGIRGKRLQVTPKEVEVLSPAKP